MSTEPGSYSVALSAAGRDAHCKCRRTGRCSQARSGRSEPSNSLHFNDLASHTGLFGCPRECQKPSLGKLRVSSLPRAWGAGRTLGATVFPGTSSRRSCERPVPSQMPVLHPACGSVALMRKEVSAIPSDFCVKDEEKGTPQLEGRCYFQNRGRAWTDRPLSVHSSKPGKLPDWPASMWWAPCWLWPGSQARLFP